MANSVDPDQTAPIGAVCSRSTLFASILNSSVMVGIFFFSRRHFQMHFFLGALRVRPNMVFFYPLVMITEPYSMIINLSPDFI